MNEHERPVMALARSMAGDVRGRGPPGDGAIRRTVAIRQRRRGNWPRKGEFRRIHSIFRGGR